MHTDAQKEDTYIVSTQRLSFIEASKGQQEDLFVVCEWIYRPVGTGDLVELPNEMLK